MRKVLTVVALFTLLVLGQHSAFAAITNWDMNLNSLNLQATFDGGFNWTSYISNINLLNISNAGLTPTSVTQSLGGDGILNNGDTFAEFGMLRQIGVNSQPVVFKDVTSNTQRFVYAAFTGLTGSIYDYDAGLITPGSTTLGNYATNIQDDTFQLTFDPGVGSIAIFLDTDLDPSTGTPISLATFTLLQGGGQSPQFLAGAVPNGTFDLTLGYTSVANNLWRLPNGQYFETVMATSSDPVLLGLTNVNAGIVYLGNDQSNLLFGIENSGTFRVAAVPEPGSMLLLGMGLLGLVPVVRRKKAA